MLYSISPIKNPKVYYNTSISSNTGFITRVNDNKISLYCPFDPSIVIYSGYLSTSYTNPGYTFYYDKNIVSYTFGFATCGNEHYGVSGAIYNDTTRSITITFDGGFAKNISSYTSYSEGYCCIE